MEEIITTDPNTGGQKGQKIIRMDLVPWDVIWELARHYGVGIKKYSERNWEKGYRWSLSFAAALRHLLLFWMGEEIDKETGSKHLICAIWHLCSLVRFSNRFPELDDRPKMEFPDER